MKRPLFAAGLVAALTSAASFYISYHTLTLCAYISFPLAMFCLLFLKKARYMAPFILLAGIIMFHAGIVNGKYEAVKGFAGQHLDLKIVIQTRNKISGKRMTGKIVGAIDDSGREVSELRGKSIVVGSFSGIDAGVGDTIAVRGTPELTDMGSRGQSVANGVYFTMQLPPEYSVARIPNSPSLYYRILVLRDKLGQAIHESVSGNSGLLAAAMVTGEKALIPNRIQRSFSRAGLSHIISVSGLHLSIIMGVLAFLLSTFRIKGTAKAFLSIVLMVFIVVFTGLKPSIVRAGIMMSVVLLSSVFYKETDSLNNLGLAAAVIILFSPLSGAATSFVLSFTSTAGIIMLAPPICRFIASSDSKPIKALSVPISVTLSALAATTPFLILIFGEVSFVAPITNLLVVVLVPFFLTLSLLAPLGGIFASLTSSLGDVIISTAEFFGRLRLASIKITDMTARTLLFFLIFAVLLSLFARRKVVTACAIVVSVLIFSSYGVYSYTRDKDVLSITTLSYRNSGAIISINSMNAIVGFGRGSSSGRLLSEYMLKNGKSDLDAVIVMRNNSTNIEALTDMADLMYVDNIYVYKGENDNIVSESDVAVNFFDRGSVMMLPHGVSIYTVGGTYGYAALVEYKGSRITLLSAKPNLSDEDVRRFHGSDLMIADYATTEELLAVLEPKAVFIADEDASQHHYERIKSFGITQYTTDENEITFKF